jgi:predicted dehydrogenase
MSPIRSFNSVTIAVIGTGLIGPRHADAIQAEPEAELFCVVDPNPAAKQVAALHDVSWFGSISEMVRLKGNPDGALVCTPNSSHVAVSKELLSAGINVLCEKPLATDVQDGKELVGLSVAAIIHILRLPLVLYYLACILIRSRSNSLSVKA